MHLLDRQRIDIATVRVLTLDPMRQVDDAADRSDVLSTDRSWRFPILNQSLCGHDQAAEVVDLWNGLPDGKMARCHLPTFALQFILPDASVLTAALCWRCNNISFAGRWEPPARPTFDGGSDAGRRLRRLCESVIEAAARPGR